MTAIHHMSATALSEAIASGSISCVETMQAFLTQIEATNPAVNALINLYPPEHCLALAVKADEALRAGQRKGWLHGMPIAIKDLAHAADFQTTFGSRIFESFIATADDPHVARIRAAGAIIIGKTNVPEWGLGGHTQNSLHGLTRNALDHRLTAGGSSGGAATALASHMLPLADGSDMMGSLRTPAAFQSIVGFRPTPGRVPAPVELDPFELKLVSLGPMGRNVADTSALFETMCGSQIDRSFIDTHGIRIGWLGNAGGYWPTTSGLVDHCERALKGLSTAGFTVEHSAPPPLLRDLWQCWITLRQHALSSARPIYDNPEHRQLMGPQWQWELKQGMGLTAWDIAGAKSIRHDWIESLQASFTQYDVIAAPACQVYPFNAENGPPKRIESAAMDTYHRWLEVSLPASLGSLPVINLPLAAPSAGQATGIQFMAPAGKDETLLQFAAAAEPILLGEA